MNEVASAEADTNSPWWHRHISFTILVLALLTALGAMLAGNTANTALIERTEEILEVNNLQGDRNYVETLKSKHEILTALGKSPDQAEIEAVAAFEKEMRELAVEAADEEAIVLTSTHATRILTTAVALLSVGTALCGMSIIANRKYLWIVGLIFGVFGAIGVGLGVIDLII
ncbi:MAG: DUF4337 family protein [Chloroflexota bacterium]|nr:DUF4337 family protein [Chloroflexota bacterium]